MPRKISQSPVILPARMSLTPDAFDGLEIATLEMPYQEAIKTFMSDLKPIVGTVKMWHYPSYRLLNNAIAACAPTIVHGFESYGRWPNKGRRMLAVGSISGSPALQYPSVEQVARWMRVWINRWGKSTALKRHVEGKAQEIWQALEQSIDQPPDTQWRRINPASFIDELYKEGGLAFQAVPSLLATLLHEKTSVIGKEEREVRWRRSQDDNKGLCLVSDPLHISFEKPKYKSSETETKEGFFTYKLEFRLHTQVGRPEPWIHVFLRCQRYASESLRQNKRWNNITILTGMNKHRIEECGSDTTLVRLKAKPSPDQDRAGWIEELPSLLEDMNARALANPFDIYQHPQTFWPSTNDGSSQVIDEYYIPHVEGYKYSNRRNHTVATGFGLAERSEIVEQTCCKLLSAVLEPDVPLQPDRTIFDASALPLGLQTFGDLSEKPKLLDDKQAKKKGIGTSLEERQSHQGKANVQQRKDRQPLIKAAIARALGGKDLIILIVYRTESTKVAVRQQLRDSFLLNEGDDFPSNVTVQERLVLDANLLNPLETGEYTLEIRNRPKSQQPSGFEQNWRQQIRRSHNKRMQAWRSFLDDSDSKTTHSATQRVAFIELFEESSNPSEFHKSQSPKGAIREACAREEILSQMIFPVKKTLEESAALTGKTKGRVQNAVQDLVSRQLGVLYGELKDVYQSIGFAPDTSAALDIVAFCIAETNLDVRYCCAVRLNAAGEIHVLLPGGSNWILYTEAGWHAGQAFAEGRKSSQPTKKTSKRPSKKSNPIKLSNVALIDFVESTLKTRLERPTIALIKATKWRNSSKTSNGWSQLRNGSFAENIDQLCFDQDRNDSARVHSREDSQFDNLLAVIRIRTGDETPQYITNRTSWEDQSLSRDLAQLSGFTEVTPENIFHYFSVGRLPATVKKPQSKRRTQDPYKLEEGGGVAFKHQQMIEMVPFYVHPNFQDEVSVLCRVPHYLRSSPGWSMGNTILPYPMHLGDQLIDDQLCILPDDK